MAIKNANDFVNSAEYAASLKEHVAHKAWSYATNIAEEKLKSTNSDYAVALRTLDDFAKNGDGAATLSAYVNFCKERLHSALPNVA